MMAPRIVAWMLIVALASSSSSTVFASVEDVLSPDNNDNKSPSEFLYFDPQENYPVMELVTAQAGDENNEARQSRGDFRLSDKPKMIEFYNPFCVRAFLSSVFCFVFCVNQIIGSNIVFLIRCPLTRTCTPCDPLL